jgi:hypothetical protein
MSDQKTFTMSTPPPIEEPSFWRLIRLATMFPAAIWTALKLLKMRTLRALSHYWVALSALLILSTAAAGIWYGAYNLGRIAEELRAPTIRILTMPLENLNNDNS